MKQYIMVGPKLLGLWLRDMDYVSVLHLTRHLVL